MIPDNYDIWSAYEKLCARYDRKLPTCECCGEPIRQYTAVVIKGDYYCDDCLNEMRKETCNCDII